MTKAEAQQQIMATGDRGLSFIANVIENWHNNQARKLKGLAHLVAAGHAVRLEEFDIDGLLIDGHKASWCVLEEWATRTN